MRGSRSPRPSFVVARDSEEEIAAGVQFVKQQIAFYGSTPAYRPVLELHGWGDLQDELNAMTKRGAWDEMAGMIDDEILHTFAVIGTPEEAAAEIQRRYGDVATRVTLTHSRRGRPRSLGSGVRHAARPGEPLIPTQPPRRAAVRTTRTTARGRAASATRATGNPARSRGGCKTGS